MPPKEVKLNKSPEINLNWTDDETSYYWKVSKILKPRKYAEVQPCLTQQLLAFFLNISLFLGQIQNYFFVPKFQMSLAYNHS